MALQIELVKYKKKSSTIIYPNHRKPTKFNLNTATYSAFHWVAVRNHMRRAS